MCKTDMDDDVRCTTSDIPERHESGIYFRVYMYEYGAYMYMGFSLARYAQSLLHSIVRALHLPSITYHAQVQGGYLHIRTCTCMRLRVAALAAAHGATQKGT